MLLNPFKYKVPQESKYKAAHSMQNGMLFAINHLLEIVREKFNAGLISEAEYNKIMKRAEKAMIGCCKGKEVSQGQQLGKKLKARLISKAEYPEVVMRESAGKMTLGNFIKSIFKK